AVFDEDDTAPRGAFEVSVDGTVVYSMLETGEMPSPAHIADLIRSM
ncbi:selenoprotein, Rdx type, partial [Kipferlia bialata]